VRVREDRSPPATLKLPEPLAVLQADKLVPLWWEEAQREGRSGAEPERLAMPVTRTAPAAVAAAEVPMQLAPAGLEARAAFQAAPEVAVAAD